MDTSGVDKAVSGSVRGKANHNRTMSLPAPGKTCVLLQGTSVVRVSKNQRQTETPLITSTRADTKATHDLQKNWRCCHMRKKNSGKRWKSAANRREVCNSLRALNLFLDGERLEQRSRLA